MFHLAGEKKYENAGFAHSSPSRAEFYHVQEILVCVWTLEFAGLRLEYIHLLICICSSAGFDLQREDSTVLWKFLYRVYILKAFELTEFPG